MKLKKEYLILLLIIVALSVYLYTRSKDQTHFELPRPAQADSQKINRLLITKNGRSIELNKKDDQWTIGPKAYVADSIKVKNMVKAAAELTITDLISESGNYERYDLNEKQKINVQAFEGNAMVRNFDVGKGAPTNQHTFVLLADNSNVYHARGHLNTTFDHTVDELRDLTVLSFQKNDITSMVLQKGEQSLTIAKKDLTSDEKAEPADQKKQAEQKEEKDQTADQENQAEQKEAGAKTQWQDPKGQPVDQPTVERLLSDFSKFRCNDYMADDEAEALKKKTPTWSLTFKSEKETHTLSVFDQPEADDTTFPALSSSEPYAFTITKSQAETIQKQIEKLLQR